MGKLVLKKGSSKGIAAQIQGSCGGCLINITNGELRNYIAAIFLMVSLIAINGCAVVTGALNADYIPNPDIKIPTAQKIPLKVAVIIEDQLTQAVYHNSDSNHYNDGKYNYHLRIGQSITDLIKKGLPLVFEQVVFLPSAALVTDQQAIIFPKINDVHTSNGKVTKQSDCSYKRYRIDAGISYSLNVVSTNNEVQLKFSDGKALQKEENWFASCSGGRTEGGADGKNYGQLMADAEAHVFSQIVSQIKSSNSLYAFIEGLKMIETMAKQSHQSNFKELAIVQADQRASPAISSSVILSAPGIGTAQKNIKYTGNPFKTIEELTQKKIDQYLTPRAAMDVNSQVPLEIKKPELPVAPKLIKTQFETKADFEQRVNKAMEERDVQIKGLQEMYRRDVEARNQKIEQLRQAYESDVEEIKKRQEIKKAKLQEVGLEFMREAFLEVMGEPVMEAPVYDAETETMQVDFRMSNADYKKKVDLKVPRSVAQTFHSNINKVAPLAIFAIEDNAIKLKGIKAIFDKTTYVATLTDKQFMPEKIEVALKENKVDFKADQQVNLKLQNPNLIDQYRVSAISYGESAQAYGKNYNDDLTPQVKSYQANPIDPKKWLFMIAVENYDETDKVIFAKNSAEAFKEIAQKAFGISEQNTISLIDDKATGQAIIGKLGYFLKERLKEGDIVYFYYSGHGVPDNDSGESFILPKDNIPDYIAKEERFKLANIYKQLSDSKASKIVAFIDACFSGRTDAGQMFKGTAPALSRTKTVKFDESKMTVLSAAGNNQYANAFDEKGHRMFSYYLVKTLLTSKPDSMEMLFKRVSADVHDASSPKGPARLQDPQISGNVKMVL